MNHEIIARLRPSAAHRWLNCPGSVHVHAETAAKPTRSQAEGTATHAIAEALLKGHKDIPDTIRVPGRDPTEFTDVNVTDDMLRMASVYATNVRKAGDAVVEKHADLGELYGVAAGTIGGTPDAVVWAPDTLEVHDLKSGAMYVRAEENEQLMIYAAGLLLNAGPLADDITKVRLVIHQTRMTDEPEVWECDRVTLHAFMSRVQQTVAKIATADPMALEFNPSDTACKWCSYSKDCPARAKQQTDAWFAVEQAPATPQGISALSADELAALRAQVPILQDRIKMILAEVDGRLLSGRAVPGWKLVKGKKGPRKWAKEDDEIVAALKGKIKAAALWDKSLKSPTQIAKLLPDESVLEGLIEQSDGAIQSAPESDKRPAYTPTSDFEVVS